MATLTESAKSSLRREMEAIVGTPAVLSDPEELLVYESDGLTLFRALADFVVFPTSAEQVAAPCPRTVVPVPILGSPHMAGEPGDRAEAVGPVPRARRKDREWLLCCLHPYNSLGIHSSLRVTPAMAAEVTDRVLALTELLT